jgi:DNA-binding response OmpR family regulator
VSDEKPIILSVDRNRRNSELLAQFLAKQGYQVLSAASQAEIESVLANTKKIELVLLDISGFDRQIWSLCQRLQEKAIPFVAIAAPHQAGMQQACLARGALGLLVKPLVARNLLQLIRNLLQRSG